ncbi:DUF6265 family protein [Winogradskyella sp. PG-2]|uniref:DUF6265 family protein n=1 Tax=Winogradskyella sp. PG-2 TaxID=754409 RepID=UPI00045862E3|nr:DUF6265 family protein [Winogradskyella sp. PG-2]BAO76783.1 hypothetical protein WPG_2553 [Winogradskyella sp. PG-2]
MIKFLTFTFCVFTLALFSQEKTLEPKLENIAWIAGTWHGEAFGGQAEEIWSEPSNGSMMATFKFTINNRVSFYEIEIIRELENTLVLQLKHFRSDLKGWENKDETVDFPLKEITENKVVFEGMYFEKISESEMNVYVDIENDKGDVETAKFTYRKTIEQKKTIKQLIKVKHTEVAPTLDGLANEAIWQNAQWQPLDQTWLGNQPTEDDFKGKYKLAWTEDALYLLAEIQDDKLIDIYEDPLTTWWDDDCLEVFIDEDNSGGHHQFTHNAFAYHIALDGNVVDMSTKREGKLYNSHVASKVLTKENISIWEVKISLYDDTYTDDGNNTPLKLYANRNVGFALAYCDNDNSKTRENFIGSVEVQGDDKNRGWIDAGIFGTLLLVK